MEVKIGNAKKARKEITATFSAEETQASLGRARSALNKEIKLPGFRKGRVPDDMLQKRFAKEIEQKVIQDLFPKAIDEGMEKGDLKPAAEPAVNKVDFQDGGSLVLVGSCSVLPDIPDIPIDSFKKKAPSVVVSDEEIDKALKELQDEFANKEEIEKGKPENGDEVVLDLDGKVDGKSFQGSASKDYTFRVGTNAVIPEIEAAAINLEPGQSGRAHFEYPRNTASKDLAGKKAIFEIILKKRIQRKPAPLDDALARRAGAADLKALKDDLSTKIREGKTGQARGELVKEALDKMAAKNKFDIPEEWIHQETRAVLGSVLEQMKIEGKDPQTDEKAAKEAMDRAMEQAETQLRAGLVLEQFAKKQGIEVSDQEIARAVQADPAMPPETVVRGLEQRGELTQVRARIKRTKSTKVLYDVLTA